MQQLDDKIVVSERDSQYTNQQRPGVPTSEIDELATFMESTSDQSNPPHFDSRGAASEENVYYPGTPASMGREQSTQYDQTTPTDQDMVDCESHYFQTLPLIPCV